ncbi:MAG: hypothetical protein GW763_07605 [Paraglaciecola sp.]|nr:hypothetical protein [Paraglaciecola sp.]NCT47844.1 hypothetical protein [Paraglaciecola sp.]
MGLLRRLAFLCVLVLGSQTSAVARSLIVVANTHQQNIQLDRQQVRALFMGAPTGLGLTPVALPIDSAERVLFNTKVIGLTEHRIQSYWAQMKFAGKNKPPMQLNSVDDVIAHLLAHPFSVGYVLGDKAIPETLSVVFRIEE